MISAIQQELALRRSFFTEETRLQSVYFGGGTPSVLSPLEVAGLIQTIQSFWGIAAGAEITLEGNPDDLSVDYIRGLRNAGINRISIGVQSFKESDLTELNRSHDASQALQALEICRQGGISNVTMDLIFGLPGSSLEGWAENLQQLLAIRPAHASIYSLTVEEKTALAHQIRTGNVSVPDDEAYEAQFRLAHALMTEAGYEHYELSNYALPGHRAQHNAAYWDGEPYLGVGPSAHSYDGQRRSWNIAHNQRFLDALASGRSAIQGQETLSLTDQYHEYLMLGLRTLQGIDQQVIKKQYLPDWHERFGEVLEKWKASGALIETDSILSLSPEGWFLSDHIAADLFV